MTADERSETAVGHPYTQALREILDAWRTLPATLYYEEGFMVAVGFLVVSPILVPLAAVFYFSIPRDQRELLNESRDGA